MISLKETKVFLRIFNFGKHDSKISYALRKIELASSCVIGGFFELAAKIDIFPSSFQFSLRAFFVLENILFME